MCGKRCSRVSFFAISNACLHSTPARWPQEALSQNPKEHSVRIYCTHVMREFDCDTFFPTLDWDKLRPARLVWCCLRNEFFVDSLTWFETSHVRRDNIEGHWGRRLRIFYFLAWLLHTHCGQRYWLFLYGLGEQDKVPNHEHCMLWFTIVSNTLCLAEQMMLSILLAISTLVTQNLSLSMFYQYLDYWPC